MTWFSGICLNQLYSRQSCKRHYRQRPGLRAGVGSGPLGDHVGVPEPPPERFLGIRTFHRVLLHHGPVLSRAECGHDQGAGGQLVLQATELDRGHRVYFAV